MTPYATDTLPPTFIPLGMSRQAAAVLQALSITPRRIIKQARKCSLNGEIIWGNDGKCHLRANGLTHVYDVQIPTGAPGYTISTLIGFKTIKHQSGARLCINHLEVAIPFLSNYIRPNDKELFDVLYADWNKAFFLSKNIRSPGINRLLADFCIRHYDKLEQLEVNDLQLQKLISSLLGEEPQRLYAEAITSDSAVRISDFLSLELRQLWEGFKMPDDYNINKVICIKGTTS